jgi:glyoxylase-like metal-dependent hydrolase (beta-lactamase superfamily II)
MVLGSDSRFLDAVVLGAWQANCYVLGDLALESCVVVDPGQGGEDAVREMLQRRGVRCEAVLLTHGHLDHLWAAPALSADLDVEVLLHLEDRYLWDNPMAAFGAGMDVATLEREMGLVWEPARGRLRTFADGERFSFAGLSLTARHTPGHTPGSSVFLVEAGTDDPLLLSGDLLFAGSVGRTDFPRGSYETQQRSLSDVVLPLEDRTVVRSGHGPVTTVGRERATNPFLAQLR